MGNSRSNSSISLLRNLGGLGEEMLIIVGEFMFGVLFIAGIGPRTTKK